MQKLGGSARKPSSLWWVELGPQPEPGPDFELEPELELELVC